MLEILLGAAIYAAGFFTCLFFVKKQTASPNKQIDTQKRVRASLRNPLRTYEVNYEPYKSSDTKLYQPVKPKRKSAVNEVDTDDV